MHEAGNPKLVLYDTWVGREGGGEVQERGDTCACGQFMSMYSKNITIW